MKINIIRRIEALEQRAKKSAQPPSLIMICFDKEWEKWKVTEHYTVGNWKDPKDYRSKTSAFDCLQDVFFPTTFRGRVILDTFASPDPAIYGNLFCFDIDDLRDGQDGEIAIQSITEPENEKSITVRIDTCTKKEKERK